MRVWGVLVFLPKNQMLLVERKVLKRSSDNGTLAVRDVIRKSHRSIPDILLHNTDEDTLALLEQSPDLGKGVYGQAKQIDEGVVAKITGCASGLLGDVAHAVWRAEHVEPRLLQFLWTHLVETNVTPHLVAPLGGTHTIIEGTTRVQKEGDKEIANSLVYFMEKAAKGTVRSYLKQLTGGPRFDAVLRVILFQVCYTMAAIYMRFPHFRHNDLKDDNVLLHEGPTEGCTAYTIHGSTFYVPNVGLTVLVADLDFACISGHTFDNYKVVEQEWETPSYHISGRKDHAADMACFINYVRNVFANKITRSFRGQLEKIYGLRKRDNGYRFTFVDTCDLPAASDLLSDTPLFDAFRKSTGKVTDTYNADRLQYANIEWPLVEAPLETRFCFMFVPRHADAIDPSELPSYRYLQRCKPAYNYIDGDLPKEYNDEKCEKLLELMAPLYDIIVVQKAKKHVDRHDDFFDKVDEIAAAFIIDYYVPERWWPAAFTCAFIDACEELDVITPGQVCWHFNQWCKFWERHGVVRYSDMNLMHFAVQWGWLRN